MKKVLLGCVTCLLALGLVTACDEEEDVVDEGNTSIEQGTETTEDGTTPSTPSEPKTYDHYVLVGDFVDASWDANVGSTSPYYLALSEDASENYWEITVTISGEPVDNEWWTDDNQWDAGLRVTSDDWAVTIAGYKELNKWSDSNLTGDDENNVKLEWNASYDVTIDLREEEPKLTVALVDTYSNISKVVGENPIDGGTYYLGFETIDEDEEIVTKFVSLAVGEETSIYEDEDDAEDDEGTYYEVTSTFVDSVMEATPVCVELKDNDDVEPDITISITTGEEVYYFAFDGEFDEYDEDEAEYQPFILCDNEDGDYVDLYFWNINGFIFNTWDQVLAVNEESETDEIYFVEDEDIEDAYDDDEFAEEYDSVPIYLFGASSDFDSHYEAETEPEDGRDYLLGYLDEEGEPSFITIDDHSDLVGFYQIDMSIRNSQNGALTFTINSVEDGFTLNATIGEYDVFLTYADAVVEIEPESVTIPGAGVEGEDKVSTYEPGVFNVDIETGYLTYECTYEVVYEEETQLETLTYIVTILGDSNHANFDPIEENKLGEDQYKDYHPLQLLYSVRDFA